MHIYVCELHEFNIVSGYVAEMVYNDIYCPKTGSTDSLTYFLENRILIFFLLYWNFK